MAHKIVVSLSRSVPEGSIESKRKAVADVFCVCPEDVIFLSDGLSVSVVDVPADLLKAREKADADAEKEAEKKAKEEAKALAAAEEPAKPETHAHGRGHK